MKTIPMAALAVGLAFTAPAAAMEHSAVIEHPSGPITADYIGTTRITMTQVGAAGGAGRASSLRCRWSVSLSVERSAQVSASLQAKRAMVRDGVLTGSSAGWCSERGSGIDRIVDARRDTLRSAMMAMVARDREVILVEAETARARQREG